MGALGAEATALIGTGKNSPMGELYAINLPASNATKNSKIGRIKSNQNTELVYPDAPDQAMLHAIPHTGAFALPDAGMGTSGRFEPQHGTTKLS